MTDASQADVENWWFSLNVPRDRPYFSSFLEGPCDQWLSEDQWKVNGSNMFNLPFMSLKIKKNESIFLLPKGLVCTYLLEAEKLTQTRKKFCVKDDKMTNWKSLRPGHYTAVSHSSLGRLSHCHMRDKLVSFTSMLYLGLCNGIEAAF